MFLDRQKIRYDVTTDLTLAASRSGLTGEREGVLLAGPLRWVPTQLARRLRRYATEGGRVASFGADTLRRGVAVARDRLLRPLPPTDTDPFGARCGRCAGSGRPAAAPAGRRRAGDGLLTGVEQLPGFAALEESQPSERVRVALAAVDQDALDAAEAAGEQLPPSLPRSRSRDVGKGIVIRVGLPEWGARLSGLGAGAAADAQHRRHPARRRRPRSGVRVMPDADTAVGPEVVRALGIVIAAALAAAAILAPHVARRAPGRCSARSRSRPCCSCCRSGRRRSSTSCASTR